MLYFSSDDMIILGTLFVLGVYLICIVPVYMPFSTQHGVWFSGSGWPQASLETTAYSNVFVLHMYT